MQGRKDVNPDSSLGSGRTSPLLIAENGAEGVVNLLWRRKDVNPNGFKQIRQNTVQDGCRKRARQSREAPADSTFPAHAIIGTSLGLLEFVVLSHRNPRLLVPLVLDEWVLSAWCLMFIVLRLQFLFSWFGDQVRICLGKLTFLPLPCNPTLLLNNRISFRFWERIYLRIHFWVKDVPALNSTLAILFFSCLIDRSASKGLSGKAC